MKRFWMILLFVVSGSLCAAPISPVQGLEAVEQAMKNTDLKDVVWISRISAVQEDGGVTVELTAQTFSREDIVFEDMVLCMSGLHVEVWDAKEKTWKWLVRFEDGIAPCYSLEPYYTTRITSTPQKLGFFYDDAQVIPEALGEPILRLSDSDKQKTEQGTTQKILIFGCVRGTVSKR